VTDKQNSLQVHTSFRLQLFFYCQIMSQENWKSLVDNNSLSIFKESNNNNWDLSTIHDPWDVPSMEEPVSDPSSWKELKDATLNEDFDNEEDVVLASNGEVSVPPSTASRFNHYDILF
jgi:hypothetical protein